MHVYCRRIAAEEANMIQTLSVCCWIQVWVLWHMPYVRWAAFHGTVGLLNYGTALLLFVVYGFDKYTSTTVGHVVHVFFGFFYDRDVTFRATKRARAWVKYWLIEAVSFASIILTIWVMVDLLSYNWFVARFLFAMVISSVISYGLNKWLTFERGGQSSF